MGSAVAWRLMPRTLDPGVGCSSHTQVKPCCVLEQDTFTPQKCGGHRGRVGKVAEFQRSLSFYHLTAVTGVGSSAALATCKTSHVLLVGVSGGFPGVLPFRPTFRLACLDVSEIILKGTLN